MPEPLHRDGSACPVRWSGRQAVVVLPGQVGLSNAGPVGEQLLAILGRGAAVLIADMTATRSCDHAGTDALARAYQRAVAHSTELRLVVPAPAVRRVVALSGLDQLVSVFSTLEAAQSAQPPQAMVLPLPRRVASNGFATLAPPDGLRPVARLPVAGPASLDGSGHATQQGMGRGEFEGELTRITNGIFHAGLTLQTALDQPADDLRRAAEHALDLLDETVREARNAAFASHRRAAYGPADTADPRPAEGEARPGLPQGAGRDALGLQAEALLARSRSIRAQSQEARARSLKASVMSAATGDRVAAALGQLAVSHPCHSTDLRALSQAVASHAARTRQWANDRAATG